MHIEAVICKNQGEKDNEFVAARHDGRTLLTIEPKMKYAVVEFDTKTADPSICRQLTATGCGAVKDAYLAYWKEYSKSSETSRYVRDYGFSSGPNWGDLLVWNRDTKRFVNQLVTILENPEFWETSKRPK